MCNLGTYTETHTEIEFLFFNSSDETPRRNTLLSPSYYPVKMNSSHIIDQVPLRKKKLHCFNKWCWIFSESYRHTHRAES